MFRLPSGEHLLVRPITVADQWRFQQAWAQMSPRTRYLRFHGGHLSEDEPCLRYLTNVDQQRHVAYGAVLADHEDHPGVGVLRFVRSMDDPTCAELAITVVDAYQQQGVGRHLLDCAVDQALQRGIERFTFRILHGRHRLHSGLQRLGAQVRALEDGALVYDFPLQPFLDRAATPPHRHRQTEWPAPAARVG